MGSLQFLERQRPTSRFPSTSQRRAPNHQQTERPTRTVVQPSMRMTTSKKRSMGALPSIVVVAVVLLALCSTPSVHGFTPTAVSISRRRVTSSARGEKTNSFADYDVNEDGSVTTALTPTSTAEQSASTTTTSPMELSQQRSTPFSSSLSTLTQPLLHSYWGPRALLALVPAIYGTNFALGSLMDASLPAAEVTALRMTLAATALVPFLVHVERRLLPRAILAGSCTAVGALVDTDPARVSFLGAAMVLWCPVLEWLVDGRDLRWHAAPQTWMSAVLCLLGVGILEGVGGSASLSIAGGDMLALLQAIGFGTQCFLCSKLMEERPSQVLPITAVLIATTAILSWIWCGLTLTSSDSATFVSLPTLVSDPALFPVLGALLWTGLVSTSGCFAVEVAALGRVPSSEASVLLATEPIWAALLASVWLGTSLTTSDYTGGALLLAACLVNACVAPGDVQRLLGRTAEDASNSVE